MSGIGYVCKENKLVIVRDEYKLVDSLNKVATHECSPATRSDITNVMSAKTVNYVWSDMNINYELNSTEWQHMSVV